MPKKGKGYKGNSNPSDTPFSELPHHEKLRRAKSAKKSANTDMKAARKAGNKDKEAGATKAWNAARRVINRLGETGPPAKDLGKEGRSQASSSDKSKKKPTMSLGKVAEIARRKAAENR